MLTRAADSVLVVIDMQPNFLAAIDGKEEVLKRCIFLARCAAALGIPIFATEQYPSRMGHTEETLREAMPGAQVEGKMIFSAYPALKPWLESQGRSQVVICGIETPICVNQTAHELKQNNIEVFVAEDAVGGRSALMHRNGLERMRAIGCEIAHGDSIVYEWMQTAGHPQFRDILRIVKESSAGA